MDVLRSRSGPLNNLYVERPGWSPDDLVLDVKLFGRLFHTHVILNSRSSHHRVVTDVTIISQFEFSWILGKSPNYTSFIKVLIFGDGKSSKVVNVTIILSLSPILETMKSYLVL